MNVDPDSVNNLASNTAYPTTLEHMRKAIKQHTSEINDNGFLPEGSSFEGCDASRKAGAYPIERVFDIATIASKRNPRHLPRLNAALDDDCGPIRWCAAQGCTILGAQATHAESALRKHLNDPSGAVRVVVAEAVASLGKLEVALPALEQCLLIPNTPAFIQQAANVLDRLGERARSSLPAMKRSVEPTKPAVVGTNAPQHILTHAVAVLEGKTPTFVYPAAKKVAQP